MSVWARVAGAAGPYLRQARVSVGPVPFVLRSLHLLATLGAVALAVAAAPGELAGAAAVAVAVLGGWGAVRPGGHAPAATFALLAVWWVIVGGGQPLGVAASFAGLVALAHLVAAQATVLPAHAAATPAAARALLRRGGGYLVVVVAGTALVAALGSAGVPRGWPWVAGVAVALVAGAVAVVRRRDG